MKKLPKSIRKFVRREKARIRREVLNVQEQERLINELYKKFLKHPREHKRKNRKKLAEGPVFCLS